MQHCIFLLEKNAGYSRVTTRKRQHPIPPHRRSNNHHGTQQDHQAVSGASRFQRIVDDDRDGRRRVRGFPAPKRQSRTWLTAQPQSYRSKPCLSSRAPMESCHRGPSNRSSFTLRSNSYCHHHSIRDGEEYRRGTCRAHKHDE